MCTASPRLCIAALTAALLVVLSACWSDPDPRPEAPAAGEVRELRDRETTERTKAAEATAAGNDVAASYHRRLADELTKLRKEADARAAEQQLEMDRRAEAEARAADLRAWQRWCRILGAAGVGLGALACGLLWWLGSPRLGFAVGGSLAGAGLAVTAFGESARLLVWLLPVCLGLALIAFAIAIIRVHRVAATSSRLADEIERGGDVVAAKAAAAAAQAQAGLTKRMRKWRGQGAP